MEQIRKAASTQSAASPQAPATLESNQQPLKEIEWRQPVQETHSDKTIDVDAPPDVNLDIFHTTRGSQLRDSKKGDAGALKRPPSAPTVSRPSWFKDFGHEKTTPAEEQGEAPSQAGPKGTAATPAKAEHLKTTAPSSAAGKLKDVTTSARPLQDTTSPSNLQTATITSKPESISVHSGKVNEHTEKVEEILAESGAKQSAVASEVPSPTASTEVDRPRPKHALRESKVPATRLSRMWNYGGLAAGMLGGAITETFSRGFGGGGSGSVMLSAGNMERLVAKLSRMRGAALKLGQMMSFQDTKMLPAPIHEVLQRVQDRADYMPSWQRDRVMKASLGPEWRDLFEEFSETPIAAASIGQVHTGVLKSTGEKVAIKIQFPGVADSITSDLDNLSMLLTASKLLPKGLYLNKTIDNMRTELGWECDYIREADCAARYRELLSDEPDVFVVPKMYPEACGKHVLTMEFMQGVGVTRVSSFTQEQRDWIGTQILRLCLRELTEFRFMQTDPNWTNFQYNAATNKLELLDFGASREFPLEFVEQYVNLLAAAARSDKARVKELSESLGYLTGHESRTMLEAHVTSILTLAEPFLGTAPEVYDFHDQTITERVKALIPVMINERLAPPPEETYSLHRKLSGAFLLCAKLGSRVACRGLFDDAIKRAPFPVER